MKKYILNNGDPPSQSKSDLVWMPNTGLWPLECGVVSRHPRGCERSPATGIKRLGDGNVKCIPHKVSYLSPLQSKHVNHSMDVEISDNSDN